MIPQAAVKAAIAAWNVNGTSGMRLHEDMEPAMLAALEAAENARWIRCSDQLPPDGRWVLIRPAYGGTDVSYLKSDAKGKPAFYAHVGRKVTHWMPLPQPPPGCDS